jgi:hypothetical protein
MCVYIKMADEDNVHALLDKTVGRAEYKCPNGEITPVSITHADLGKKRIRVANLAPDVANGSLQNALAPCGTIQDIQNEKWAKVYRGQVDKGIRLVTIILKKHVPSHLTVAVQRILLTYEGQPATFYVCGEEGHLY